MNARRRRLRPSRPLRKRPRFDDLADEEPESSSDSSSSESSEGSPPPDFAADADDEEEYISALEETQSPKPQPKRPSRLAKPRSFLDAVRPYVEPLSRDAVKLSQLTMAEITAGEAYRGPLVVTDADRAEAEAARATAARLARYDSDEFVDDREEVMPQIQTRPFSLKRRTGSRSSILSNSDSELLSSESDSDRNSEPETDDSRRGYAPIEKSPASHCEDDKRQGTREETSDYESEQNRSPPQKTMRLIRRDTIKRLKRTNGGNSGSRYNHLEQMTMNPREESSSTLDQHPIRNCGKQQIQGLSKFRARSTPRPSGMPGSTAPSRVIGVIDLSQDHSGNKSTHPPRTEAVEVRHQTRSSTNITESQASSTPSRIVPSRVSDIIDLCDDRCENGDRKEVPRPMEVVDLCSSADSTVQPRTESRRRLRTTPCFQLN